MANTQAASPARAGTVVVGCKLPHGLIVKLYEPSTNEHGQKVMTPWSDPITFKGANSSTVVGGFGMTEVDADFFDAWIKQNAKFPAVVNGLIFAAERREKAVDQAIDQKEAKTGFEGINPDKPGKGIERVPEKELKAAAAQA